MFNSHLKYLAAFGVLFTFSAAASYGQTMSVKIIKRQTGDNAYDYTTPGHTDTTVRTHVKCKEGTYGEHCVKITDRDHRICPRNAGHLFCNWCDALAFIARRPSGGGQLCQQAQSVEHGPAPSAQLPHPSREQYSG